MDQPSTSYQNNNPPDNSWFPRVIVIGPGGIKGFNVLGFLSPIEDYGLLKYADTYCGVSVGAIISLLIVSGYSIREIVGEAATLDIFKDIENINFQSIFDHKGLISNEPIRKRLSQLILNKFGTIPTLYDLYMKTGRAYIATTLNATDEKCEMMGPFTHANISCVDATMFSMNIPFIFYQLIHQGKTYVDGALCNPYPVDYFDDGNTNILGIYMKTCNESTKIINTTPTLPGRIIQRIERAPDKPLSISDYLQKIIHSLMDHRRNSIIQNASDMCKHICLETDVIDSVGLNITTEVKARMLVNGFNSGMNFINQLQNNNYIPPQIPLKLRYEFPPYYIRDENLSLPVDEPQLAPVNILSHM